MLCFRGDQYRGSVDLKVSGLILQSPWEKSERVNFELLDVRAGGIVPLPNNGNGMDSRFYLLLRRSGSNIMGCRFLASAYIWFF